MLVGAVSKGYEKHFDGFTFSKKHLISWNMSGKSIFKFKAFLGQFFFSSEDETNTERIPFLLDGAQIPENPGESFNKQLFCFFYCTAPVCKTTWTQLEHSKTFPHLCFILGPLLLV